MRLSSASLGLVPMSQIAVGAASSSSDPFAILDEQKWINPDDMVWDDFHAPPGTNWSDPTVKGSERNFNIALVTLDYDDMPFVITQEANSTVFGNPQPAAANIKRKDVPSFYRDLLNTPGDLNNGHTLHEYWMEDSAGRFGVDLSVFGAYRMPALSFQYGIDDEMNPGACPGNSTCNMDIRDDGLGAWRRDVGDEVADSFELVFILSAGQDESGSWQEFGEMKFSDETDIPDEFGPQRGLPSDNFAATRYVPWTSWASAASIWPNAGGGSSTQAESSGMGVYAHELSHLLDIGDNYNNPYGKPLQRDFTGPWSMLSRGSFNGPGGPHTRWQIPALQGSSMGSLHTVRDKFQLNLMDDSQFLRLSNSTLAKSGFVFATLTARSVVSDLMGLRIEMGQDLSPECDVETDVLCDGGGYENYDLEVIDRMGADSFQPDSGVMISKTKNNGTVQPFQWTIDANPEDVSLVDFVRPNGTEAFVTMGDYRQLADALFHAGTRSGSEFEYIDKANSLHFYILNRHRDEAGVLSYDVAVRSLESAGSSIFGVALAEGTPIDSADTKVTEKGVLCSFDLTNNGTYVSGGNHTQTITSHTGKDVYRLEASVEGSGWRAVMPNALAAAKFGETVKVQVAVGATPDAHDTGVVTLAVSSESDKAVKGTATCSAKKA